MKSAVVFVAASLAFGEPNKTKAPEPIWVEGSGVKSVTVGDRDVVPVSVKMGFTTVIILPPEEEVMTAAVGDQEFWKVEKQGNFAFVKPSKAEAHTNLNILTVSGNIYSFVLKECSFQPDIKVFVETKSKTLLAAMSGQPKYVPAVQIEDYKEQVRLANLRTSQLEKETALQIKAASERKDVEIAKAKAALPATLKFDYKFQANLEPFNVSAVYTDGKFTYIRARPVEVPSLYTVADGKPNLIEFQFADDLYTIPQVLPQESYLQIGKRKLNIIRK